MRNDRGIALVVTLLVVAILTIIVIEFTYSVQVDAHMARNALNGLQATLLARSGINLGEAFLLHDDNIKFDAYTEDWGNPEQLNSQFVLPDNMRLRVQIIDEGGKLNLNLTRPRTPFEWRQAQNPENTNPPVFKRWTTAVGNLLESRGGSGEVADAISDYWSRLFQALSQTTTNPGQATGTPTPGTNQVTNPSQWDFPSLDDASVLPGLTPALVRRARPVLTALDYRQPPKVNVNTAPREVLAAIIPDAGVVDNIISQRQDQGLTVEDLRGLLDGMGRDPSTNYVPSMLGVTSNFFLIRASAIINADPLTGKGGISRSASMLVYRRQVPCVPPKSPPTVPCWTLTQLDWQKEGGAVLFQQGSDQDPGMNDPLNMGLPGMGG
jgi:general secretion pathway protein K